MEGNGGLSFMGLTLIIGKRKSGKTTALLNRALQSKGGLLYLTPHNDRIILAHLPKREVIIYDPSDAEWPIAFNPLYQPEDKAALASLLLDNFRSIWKFSDISTPTFDQTLYNTIAAVLDRPDGTLLHCYLSLRGKRTEAKDIIVKDYWTWFDSLKDKDQLDMIKSTINKLQVMMADPRIRNTLGQYKTKLNVSDVFDKGQVLVTLLPQEKLGLQKTSMLGSLILSQCVSRGTIAIDEVQHFDSPALRQLIENSEYDIIVTVQYLDQLSPELRSCLLGNATTKIAFQTGLKDSAYLREEFFEDNLEFALHKLAPFQARIIEDDVGKTVTMPTLPPPTSDPDILAMRSRRKYASPREHVEAKIAKLVGQ